jgi:hypothetical protein
MGKKVNRKLPGMSNAGKYPRVKDFAGPSGTYPINTIDRARSALRLAHNAQCPSCIKKKVYNKYPSLKPASTGGPLKRLNDMQIAKRGKIVGSMLEGGRIKYASGGPGPISPGKEFFDKLQKYSRNPSIYEQFSPAGLEKYYKKQVKRGEMSRKDLDTIKEINSLNLDWKKFKRR